MAKNFRLMLGMRTKLTIDTSQDATNSNPFMNVYEPPSFLSDWLCGAINTSLLADNKLMHCTS
jgi:hypothetical protein